MKMLKENIMTGLGILTAVAILVITLVYVLNKDNTKMNNSCSVVMFSVIDNEIKPNGAIYVTAGEGGLGAKVNLDEKVLNDIKSLDVLRDYLLIFDNSGYTKVCKHEELSDGEKENLENVIVKSIDGSGGVEVKRNSADGDSTRLNEILDSSIQDKVTKQYVCKALITGLAEVNVNSLFGENCGILYGASEQMAHIYATDIDKTVLFISAMNNPSLGNVEQNLVQYKGYDDIYIDDSFDDNSDFGYGGFAIRNKNGTLIYFKIAECVKNPHEVMDNIIKEMQDKPVWGVLDNEKS